MSALSRRTVLAAIGGAAVAAQTQPAIAHQSDQFAVALAAYRESEQAYCDACSSASSGNVGAAVIEAEEAEIYRLTDNMLQRRLDLLRTPATTPAHALVLLQIGHEGSYRTGMLDEVLPVPHLNVDDALLHNADLQDRAFIESAMRVIERYSRVPS